MKRNTNQEQIHRLNETSSLLYLYIRSPDKKSLK